jgi:hypothetical protein
MIGYAESYGEVKGSRCCSGGFFNMFQYWLLSLPWMGKLADLSFGDDILHPSLFFSDGLHIFCLPHYSEIHQADPISNTKKSEGCCDLNILKPPKSFFWSISNKGDLLLLHLGDYERHDAAPKSEQRSLATLRRVGEFLLCCGNIGEPR